MADFKRVGQHPVVVAIDAANVRAEALELPQCPAVHVALGEDHVPRVDQGLDEDVVRLAGAVGEEDIVRFGLDAAVAPQLAGDVLAKGRVPLVVRIDGELASLLRDGVPNALGQRLGRHRLRIGIGYREVVLRAVDDAHRRGLRHAGREQALKVEFTGIGHRHTPMAAGLSTSKGILNSGGTCTESAEEVEGAGEGTDCCSVGLSRVGRDTEIPYDRPAEGTPRQWRRHRTMSEGLPTAILGRTGIEVTRLGFGTALWRPDRHHWTEEAASELYNEVLDHGINFIDTAYDYMYAEDWIGRSLSDRYDEFRLATKCGCTDSQFDRNSSHHAWTRSKTS